MHIADFSVGMLGANGIVGAGLPIATGAALAAQLEKERPGGPGLLWRRRLQRGAFHGSFKTARQSGSCRSSLLRILLGCLGAGVVCPVRRRRGGAGH